MRALLRLCAVSLIAVIFCTMGCKKNPIKESGIQGGGASEIRGSVQLGEGQSPDGVHLWLEGFNISTKTNERGEFVLVLPPPGFQNSSGGVTGAFRLYFYLGNFRMVTTDLLTRSGTFVYSNGEVGASGELNDPKLIPQVLSISTVVRPSQLVVDSTAVISAEFLLQPQVDTLTVYFPRLVGDTFSPIFFRKLDTEEVFIRPSVIAGLDTLDQGVIGPDPLIRKVAIVVNKNDLPQGNYEVIPYILVKHQAVPRQLILSLGQNVERLGPEYLKIPFRRAGGHFELSHKTP